MSMSPTIIDDHLRLNILVKGDDPDGDVMIIPVLRNQQFNDLRAAIANEYLKTKTKTISDLKLFKFDLPDEQLENFYTLDKIRLDLRSRITTQWPLGTNVDENLIHILVECHVDPSLSLVTPKSSGGHPVGSPADSVDRLAQETKRVQIAFIKKVGNRNSLTGAEPKNFRQEQLNTDYIRNGRPANRSGPSIVIYHPVFGQFLSNLRSKERLPPQAYTRTIKYFTTSQDIYEQEFCEPANQSGQQASRFTARYQGSQAELKELFGKFLSRTHAPSTKPDGVISGHDGSSVLIIEMKNEIGTGSSDPSIQAAQSYTRAWADLRVRELLGKCCCPTILVAIAGPWMAILGAVFLDRPIVQPLTDFVWVGYDPARPSRTADIARIFNSVSLAVKQLSEYYLDVPKLHKNLDRFFPYITHYTDLDGNRVEFTYLSTIFGGCCSPSHKLVFLAQTRAQSPRKIIVKFVQTYNDKAHNELAKIGLAPPLLYNGDAYPQDRLGPDHFMVVMGFVLGQDLSKFGGSPLPDSVSDSVQRALKCLHDRGFVFGDLRDPNVMVETNPQGKVLGAKLVDFDWCGRHQIDQYPSNMNPEIPWAEGAGPGLLMDTRHDLEMQKRLSMPRRVS